MGYLSVDNKSLATQGLFGSQARPGMRARTRKPKHAGSLSGTCLGDDTFVDAMATEVANAQTGAAAANATAAKQAQQIATVKKVALAGGIALAAYLLLFRKKGGASATVAAAPTVVP